MRYTGQCGRARTRNLLCDSDSYHLAKLGTAGWYRAKANFSIVSLLATALNLHFDFPSKVEPCHGGEHCKVIHTLTFLTTPLLETTLTQSLAQPLSFNFGLNFVFQLLFFFCHRFIRISSAASSSRDMDRQKMPCHQNNTVHASRDMIVYRCVFPVIYVRRDTGDVKNFMEYYASSTWCGVYAPALLGFILIRQLYQEHSMASEMVKGYQQKYSQCYVLDCDVTRSLATGALCVLGTSKA